MWLAQTIPLRPRVTETKPLNFHRMHPLSSPSTTSSTRHNSAGLLPIQDTKTRQVMAPQVTRTGKARLMQCTGTASGWKSRPEYRPGLPLRKNQLQQGYGRLSQGCFVDAQMSCIVDRACFEVATGEPCRGHALLVGLSRGPPGLKGYIPCMQTLDCICDCACRESYPRLKVGTRIRYVRRILVIICR